MALSANLLCHKEGLTLGAHSAHPGLAQAASWTAMLKYTSVL